MKLLIYILLAVLFLSGLAGCNKYSNHEVKTPVPPAPQQNR